MSGGGGQLSGGQLSGGGSIVLPWVPWVRFGLARPGQDILRLHHRCLRYHVLLTAHSKIELPLAPVYPGVGGVSGTVWRKRSSAALNFGKVGIDLMS